MIFVVCLFLERRHYPSWFRAATEHRLRDIFIGNQPNFKLPMNVLNAVDDIVMEKTHTNPVHRVSSEDFHFIKHGRESAECLERWIHQREQADIFLNPKSAITYCPYRGAMFTRFCASTDQKNNEQRADDN